MCEKDGGWSPELDRCSINILAVSSWLFSPKDPAVGTTREPKGTNTFGERYGLNICISYMHLVNSHPKVMVLVGGGSGR